LQPASKRAIAGKNNNLRAAARFAFIVHGAKMRSFSWNCANNCVALAAAFAIAKL
jgi:hypothetical protein